MLEVVYKCLPIFLMRSQVNTKSNLSFSKGEEDGGKMCFYRLFCIGFGCPPHQLHSYTHTSLCNRRKEI